MRKLILIRHVETDYARQGKCCGQKDIPLNAKGVKQARYMQAKLNSMKVDKVYCSDLKRTLQTAKIVFKDKIIYKRKALREIDFGQFSGLTYKEISKIYPNAYKKLLNNPINAKMPGGENMHNFSKRIIGCFDKINNQNTKETIALISHIGPIRVIILKILNLKFDKFWDIQQDIGAINIIEFGKKKSKIIINETNYLKTMNASTVIRH